MPRDIDIGFPTATPTEAFADAVCDELLSGHTTAGSEGNVLQDAYTGIGTTLIIQKTINQNAIVAAGVDLTGVSSGGVLEVEDVIAKVATAVDSTGHAATIELYTNNVLGNGSFCTMAQAKLPANSTCDFKNATTAKKLALESGKKITVKASGEAVTSNANITFTIVMRRVTAGATIAAA